MSEQGDARVDLRLRTKDFALQVIRLYAALSRNPVAQTIGRQMLRSGTSVGAHYREAYRARSRAEFVSKMEGGLQELDETLYWMEILVDSKIVPAQQLKDLLQETAELLAIFTASAKTAKKGITRSVHPS